MAGAVNQTANLPPVGRVIREARLRAGLTLAQLGTRVGYSGATISRLERGKQQLRDVVVLRALAEALGIPPSAVGLAEAGLPQQRRTERHPSALDQGISQVQVVGAGAGLQQLGDDRQLGEAALEVSTSATSE